jgi:hypothetical protein
MCTRSNNLCEEYATDVLKMVPVKHKSRYSVRRLKGKLRQQYQGTASTSDSYIKAWKWAHILPDLWTKEQWEKWKRRGS